MNRSAFFVIKTTVLLCACFANRVSVDIFHFVLMAFFNCSNVAVFIRALNSTTMSSTNLTFSTDFYHSIMFYPTATSSLESVIAN